MRFHRVRLCIAACLALLLLSSSAFAAPTLRRDSHGHDVLLLQQKLKTIGYTITAIDGVFGPETERAVAEFQQRMNDQYDAGLDVLDPSDLTSVIDAATVRALFSE